jgi:hypothetical protein
MVGIVIKERRMQEKRMHRSRVFRGVGVGGVRGEYF